MLALAPPGGDTLRTCRTLHVDHAAAGLALLSTAHGFRVVDPNLRHGLWGSSRRAELVSAFVERCDILLGGADELAELVGAGTAESIARRCTARGPREVVIRDAENV